MRQHLQKSLLAVALLPTFAASGLSRQQADPAPAAATKPLTPLRVQVVISRHHGDSVIAFPYTLAVNANDTRAVSLRMGSQLPVPGTAGSIQYLTVGTNIDCSAASTDDGRFKVDVRIEDSSVVDRRDLDARSSISSLGIPTLRNFTTSNSVILRSGQSAQFTAATDKVTGEVVRVDVSLEVAN